MSPDDATTLQNARDVTAIVNAMLVAKGHDHRRSAAGLVAIAQILVDDDTVGRLALATLMCEAAAELLSGVTPERLSDVDVVDVRQWWH